MISRLRLVFISLFSFYWASISKAQTIYQAESNAILSGGASAIWNSDASGGGYVAITQRGSSAVAFSTVAVAEAKTYAVDFRYAAARPWISTISIYVNGIDVTQAMFPSTSSWGNWTTHTIPLTLRAGTNTIMARYDHDDSGAIDLDYIKVNPEPISTGFRLGSAATAGWIPQEISVDKFTGTAQVYVPLHTVRMGEISIPVGLAYAATGVPVDSKGGKVGVNWSLTGGVSISRQVRGLPDDRRVLAANGNRYGWLVYPAETPDARINRVPTAPAFPPTGLGSCSADEQTALQQLDQLGDLKQGITGPRDLYDTEPDIFTYSLPGHSGKFIFDAQGRIRTIAYDQITITHTGIDPIEGITSFLIRLPNGIQYVFDVKETTREKIIDITPSASFFSRVYYQYKLPASSNSGYFKHTYAWQASSITSPGGKQIKFTYLNEGETTTPSYSSRRFAKAGTTGSGTEDYRTETFIQRVWLEKIWSNSTSINFNLSQLAEKEYFIRSVSIKDAYEKLSKTFVFEYLNPKPSTDSHQMWYDRKGGALFSDAFNVRMFLHKISTTNGCSTQPLYEFNYHQTTEKFVGLPPLGANDRDYWGFYNANGSPTLFPQLYVYPQLSTQASIPAAPYRLFEAPNHTSGAFVLNGADRRPPADFNVALAGTLTSIALPSGGRAILEFEPHSFYDPVAEQSYPAGGARIRGIRAQDPVTGIEAKREYYYQEDDGRASGVLLHAPRFAFAIPASFGSSQQQWTEATVRCGEDLAEDPFETRPIGYRQVTEKMVGKGQVITSYSVPASADENTAADGVAAGIAWTRPAMGVARQTYVSPISGAVACPTLAPLQGGTDVYPFAPATNYDFRRGLPQSIIYKAEPVGNNAAAVVRQENFFYQYRNLTSALPTVTGLSYEQLINGPSNTYAYTKYPILTGFHYAMRRQTLLIPTSQGSSQSTTWLRYNNQGWLAAKAQSNSDGNFYRTRYKYLSDYPFSGVAEGSELLAMQQRLTATQERISADIIETISEIVSASGEVRFAGSTLNTFAAPNSGLTRPYQTFSWQPSTPLALAAYDSIRIVGTASGRQKLHINSNFRLASTLLESDAQLTPLSTRVEAGRQTASVQLGYSGTLPVLQIANALSSEVLFSDFESAKSNSFQARSATSQLLSASSQAARTGSAGVELSAGAALVSMLPSSTADSYRLSFWVRAIGVATISVSIIEGTGGTPPATQTIAITPTAGKWQLYETVIGMSSIPFSARTTYRIKLQTSTALQVDDVLFLPSYASAASTTYDLANGKTSETDGRGRTIFYDYNVAGELARVRDHNGAIIKQIEKVIAGRLPTAPAPTITVSGSQHYGQPISFTAESCENLEYSWDFGDNTTTPYSTSPTANHTYQGSNDERYFNVMLRARVPGQVKVYTIASTVYLRPAPFLIRSCIEGVVAVDNCGEADRLDNTCDPNSPPAQGTTSTTFGVEVDAGGTYTYIWRFTPPGGIQSYIIPGQNSPSITVSSRERNVYQCTVRDAAGNDLGHSTMFSIERFSSRYDNGRSCPEIP